MVLLPSRGEIADRIRGTAASLSQSSTIWRGYRLLLQRTGDGFTSLGTEIWRHYCGRAEYRASHQQGVHRSHILCDIQVVMFNRNLDTFRGSNWSSLYRSEEIRTLVSQYQAVSRLSLSYYIY